MAVRNAKAHTITAWRGLNSFVSPGNTDEQSWVDANNVLVNAKGEAEVLRSPNAFGNDLIIAPAIAGVDVQSMDEYRRVAGNVLIIDRGAQTLSLLAAGGEPTVVRGSQALVAWTSLSVNDRFQRINGVEFVQILNDLTTIVRNGIDPPAAAPTIAYAANGADTTVIASSLQGSYCYYNSTTGHVSQPSPLSNVLGPKAAGFDVTYTVVASSQTGVDKVLFFLTGDGGDIPYLVLDTSSSDPHTATNTTATKTIVQSTVSRDTLTPEPIYNSVPLLTATHMFEYSDRIFLVIDGGLQYSGIESVYIGNPHESWPFLNQLELLNDRAVGGISTQSGALIFGQEDCHLLTGTPSDKVSSPQNIISVTEKVTRLNWNIGTTYPKTAVSTPFGVIWTDRTKRIRLWNQQGFPSEIAQALRTELDAMTGTLTARWFQHGKNGGYYVLTNGSITLFVMLYLSPSSGQMQFGYGKSTSLAINAMTPVTFSGIERFFFANDDQVYEILSPDQAGDGWATGTEIFFKIVAGNNLNFSSVHSIVVDGDLGDLAVTHDNLRITDGDIEADAPEDIDLTDDLESDTGESFYGLVDSQERRRHVLTFTFSTDDTDYRNIDGLTLNIRNSKRAI